ncbi:MAG: insulinase family protein [Deltaproteobacteria bacterium]|jgi:predicted Zn-dependent peptidase|nr:insulinase family protein [Deltaproteobacteria bacterium]
MFNKTVLPNGIRVITESFRHSRVVSVGIWLDVGSRDEHDLNSGSAHFVEHMLFKGTTARSAQEIAREFDVLGGAANAFTTREHTCLHATVLDSNLSSLVDLFTDLLNNSLYADEEIERERQVILQEINMVEDMPDDHIHDLFTGLLWGIHPLGKSILGSHEVVSAMDSKKLQEYVQKYYTTDKIVIAAAGNVDHSDFVSLWQNAFRKFGSKSVSVLKRSEPALLPASRKIYNKPLEQAHILMGTYGLSAVDADRFGYLILNVILGGNMSSRLFQEIREKRGLAYSIYSYISSYSDCGYLAIYLGVDRETVNESLSLIAHEINLMQKISVPQDELANAKDFIKSSLFLSMENMEAIMTRIARNEINFNKYFPVGVVLESIDKVTSDDVLRLADKIFGRQELTLAGLGPLENEGIDWKS